MKTKIFYSGVLVVLFAAIVFASCSKSNGYGSSNNPPAATASVSIKNMAFNPASLSVKAGTTVTWSNSDTIIHTVTADGGSFSSGNIAIGATYSMVFNSAGTFSYHCALHPEMTGKIVVTSTGSGGY